MKYITEVINLMKYSADIGSGNIYISISNSVKYYKRQGRPQKFIAISPGQQIYLYGTV